MLSTSVVVMYMVFDYSVSLSEIPLANTCNSYDALYYSVLARIFSGHSALWTCSCVGLWPIPQKPTVPFGNFKVKVVIFQASA